MRSAFDNETGWLIKATCDGQDAAPYGLRSQNAERGVDRAPGFEHVTVVAGLSGHGFKMTPALGRAATDLALTGTSELPIGFLGAGRFRS